MSLSVSGETSGEGFRVERDGPIAVVTLDRPHKMNAVTPEMDAALAELWPQLDRDPTLRCLILTGAGDRAFSAGADIPTLFPYLRDRIAQFDDPVAFCGLTHGRRPGKPIIAAINGIAYGGGLELALACDIRIASRGASFALPEPGWGVIAAGGGATRLPRMLPPGVALDMLLTGRSLSAERAYGLGLVSELTAPDVLLPTARAIAETIAAKAPLAIEATLAIAHVGARLGLDDSLAYERERFQRLLSTEDCREGIAAFVEKRLPRFVGR